MEAKKVAILTCLDATDVCSGASCFDAVNQRTGEFGIYEQEPLQIVAFFHCNGCVDDYDKEEYFKEASFLEKIERVKSIKPDAIHYGKCCFPEDKLCPVIADMVEYFEKAGIKVIKGTHK